MILRTSFLLISLLVLSYMSPLVMAATPVGEKYPECSVANHADGTQPGSLQYIIKGKTSPVNVTFRKDCIYTFRQDDGQPSPTRVIPSNVRLKFENGAVIKTEGVFELTIQGPIEAGDYQIFDAPSNIVLSQGSVSDAPFEWWGARGDGVTDDGPSIQKAVKNLQNLRGSPGAMYLVKTPIQLGSHVTIDGKGSSVIGPPDAPIDSIFSIKAAKPRVVEERRVQMPKQWITIRNLNVTLNMAQRFAYIFGSIFIDIYQVAVTGDKAGMQYKCIDIHNSYHCTLKDLDVSIGAADVDVDHPSIGISIRSDDGITEDGELIEGYGVVDNVLIADSTIQSTGSGIQLDFDITSNNIVIRNTSIVGGTSSSTDGAPQNVSRGLRSTGLSRADFVSLKNVTMEHLDRAVSFELPPVEEPPKVMGYTLSIVDSDFRENSVVFHLESPPPDVKTPLERKQKVNLERVAISGSESMVVFGKLDALVTLMNMDQVPWYTPKVEEEAWKEAGFIMPYPNNSYHVIRKKTAGTDSPTKTEEVYVTTTEKKTRYFSRYFCIMDFDCPPDNPINAWWWLYAEHYKVDQPGPVDSAVHAYNWYGVEIDHEPVDGYVSLGPPSVDRTHSGPVTYTITYSGFAPVALEGMVDLVPGEGSSATGKVTVNSAEADKPYIRTVTISEISGIGKLGISLRAGTAVDAEGNEAPGAGPSRMFEVYNTPPSAFNDTYSVDEDNTLEIGPPGVMANDADPDGDAITAVIEQTTKNGYLTLNPDGSFTYTPQKDFNGTDEFTYRVTDDRSQNSVEAAKVTLHISAVNDGPPIISAIDSLEISEETSTGAIPFEVQDPDPETSAEQLSVSASSSNPGLIPNESIILGGSGSSRTLSITPAKDQNGTATITLQASDGQDSTQRSFELKVSPVNDAPVASDSEILNVKQGKEITGTLKASDVDNDPLTYSIVKRPKKGSIEIDSSTGAFTYRPNCTASGRDGFTFQVNDNNADPAYSNVATVPINVTKVEHKSEAGPTQRVAGGTIVVLDGRNSTVMQCPVETFQWTQIAGPDVGLSGPKAAKAKTSFRAPRVDKGGACLMFNLKVTDRYDMSSEDFCIINVTSHNKVPKADAGLDQKVVPGKRVTLDASKSSDPDGRIAGYTWLQTDGPKVKLSKPQSATPAFIAPTPAEEGSTSLVFRLIVRDQAGLASDDTVIVNVTANNEPPVANAGRERRVAFGGQTIALDGSRSTDLEEGVYRCRWTQVGGSPVVIDDPEAMRTTFTAPESRTSLTFQLMLIDDAQLRAQDYCTVEVRANR